MSHAHQLAAALKEIAALAQYSERFIGDAGSLAAGKPDSPLIR
jgi:hypothetical protein